MKFFDTNGLISPRRLISIYYKRPENCCSCADLGSCHDHQFITSSSCQQDWTYYFPPSLQPLHWCSLAAFASIYGHCMSGKTHCLYSYIFMRYGAITSVLTGIAFTFCYFIILMSLLKQLIKKPDKRLTKSQQNIESEVNTKSQCK